MPLKKEWNYKEYISLDESVIRPSFDTEIELYEAVKNGKTKELEKGLKEKPFSSKTNWGILSENNLRNDIYHFIITTALIARFCIEGGLDTDESYSLSDFYIQKADKSHSLDELSKIHATMILDYAERMKSLQKKNIISKPISKVIDYIYNHLNEDLSVQEIAQYVGLSRTYLSTLFKKETNYSINEFITRKKIQTAENMLKFSDYDILDITTILNFSSQSYFTQLFKKYIGETPKKYKNKNHEVLSKKGK